MGRDTINVPLTAEQLDNTVVLLRLAMANKLIDTEFASNLAAHLDGFSRRVTLMDGRNCNECKYISLREQDQTDKRISHVCLRYNMRVFHRSNNTKEEHMFIFPCWQCNGDAFTEA